MRKSTWAYAVAIIGAILSAANLVATHYEAGLLNALFHLAPDATHDVDRIVASLALSVATTLATSMIAIFLLSAATLDRIAGEQHNLGTALKLDQSELLAMVQQLPQTRIFGAFLSAEEALYYLARRLPDVAVIYNTRFVGTSTVPDDKKKPRETYEKAFAAALKHARAYDVVNPAWEYRARALVESAAGNYSYRVLDGPHYSLLNFIVMDYRDRSSEVVFGFTTSADSSYEHIGFRTTEQRVVEFFKRWHQELLQAAHARVGGPDESQPPSMS